MPDPKRVARPEPEEEHSHASEDTPPDRRAGFHPPPLRDPARRRTQRARESGLNLAAPHLALARSESFYELGESLRERGPEILQAAQDPANLMLGGTALAGGLAAALAAPKLAGGCWRLLHKALYADPGGVLLGTAKGGWGVTRPVYLSLADRLMHLQVVAPTGGAKTSLFEWIFCQDLKSDLTTISVENIGDFGTRAVSRALLAGKPVYLFDPTVKNTLKWNPLAGEPEEAAERAVSTFSSSAKSGSEEFFKTFNGSLFRHTIVALHAYGRRVGRRIHMGDVWEFLNDRRFRNEVLDASSSRDGKEGVRVTALNLPRKTRKWFENRYFKEWTHRQREEFTAGLFGAIDELLGRSVVEHALCPEGDEPALDLDEAVSSGGFVFLSVPQGLLGETSARTLSTWLIMSLMQAIRRRGEGGRPISLFIDEAHSMLGHASSDAAREFTGFTTHARHHSTILQLSYQSFSLLPLELRFSLDSNARNRMIAGGLGPRDAAEARAIMGSVEEEVTDRRRMYRGLLSAPGGYSVGTREMERPRLSEEEIRGIPRGYWNLARVKNGRDQEPILVRAGRAPRLPVEFKPERALVAGREGEGAVA